MVGEISSAVRNTPQATPFLYCGKPDKPKWYGSCTDLGQWMGGGNIMSENRTIHLVEVPMGGKGGFVWNHLHGEREEICEALVKDSNDDVVIENLKPFDTILLRTQNSEYRILLLDPKTGRALVEGGNYLDEPSEALLKGSAASGSSFNTGSICVGCRLEMWVDERALITSPIKSIEVKHNSAAESLQSISEALASE